MQHLVVSDMTAGVKPWQSFYFIWSDVSVGMWNRCVHHRLSLQVHVLIADTLTEVIFIQLFLFGLDHLLDVLQLLLQLPFLFA